MLRGTLATTVPTPPKDPAQRRRRNREQPKRATSTALPATSARSAPAPPKWLPKALHPDYRAVWGSSVAHLWAPSAAELVARLVQLRVHVRELGVDVRPAHLSVLLQLERELLLGPRAARASGVTLRDEAGTPAELAGDGDDEPATAPRRRSSVSKSRRDRVLRAVQ